MKLEDLVLDVEQQIDIKAPPEKVFPAVLERFGKKNTRPDGESLNLQIEAKPGGRWYRDRGNGVGHLWGFVQVIKPPTLLELSGPCLCPIRPRTTLRSRWKRRLAAAGLRCGTARSA